MHRGLAGCQNVLQVVGGKRLAAVSCVSCLSKLEGILGGGMVAGRKGVDIYGISLCRRFICVFSIYRLLVENG